MFLLVFAFTFSTGVSAKSSKEEKLNSCESIEKLGVVSYQNQNGITKKVIKIKDVEKFSKLYGMNVSPTDEVTIVVPVTSPGLNSQKINANELTILGTLYAKITRESEACGSKVLRKSTYQPPSGKMTISTTVNASYSANVTVNAQIITAGVGFNVTEGYIVANEQPITVPTGKTGTITAYPYYRVVDFNIMESKSWPFEDSVYGSGTAWEPIGVCFITKIQ